MIRTFTIVENKTEDGKTEYQVSGDFPVVEVARALVVVALHTELPKKEDKTVSGS
jgi:hypothetical protein